MKLSFYPSRLSAVDEVPVSTRVAVIAPMRHSRHIADDGIERHFGLVIVTKVFAPGIDLFLPGRVPGHLAPERIGFAFPAIGALFHDCLYVAGFLSPAFP